jgi:hypothetical protein
MSDRAERIAKLNDDFRASIGDGGHVYMTPGIQALPVAAQLEVFNLVKTFNDFSEGNDPYGERNFGAFNYMDERILWQIDYYDTDMECGSEDPADPDKTVRVLTVMLAHEY